MNIGQASFHTGLDSKTIRYYERIDLLRPAKRSENGYRDYSPHDLEAMTFIQRARSAGFNIDECRQLMALRSDKTRRSHDVKQLVLDKADHVASQIEALQIIHRQLIDLADSCQGDEQPKCAILNQLEEPSPIKGDLSND